MERSRDVDQANIKLMEAKTLNEVEMLMQNRWRFTNEQREEDEDRGDDINNRTYNFYGPVGMETSALCAKMVTNWARVATAPIAVRLCSPGGEVRSGLMVYELLAHIADDMPVRTIALGSADSMAALILQAGSTRVIGRQSSLTLHEIQIQQGMEALFSAKSMDDRRKEDEYFTKVNDRLIKVLMSRVNGKITEAELRANIKGRDWRLDPEEAIKYGFADETGWK